MKIVCFWAVPRRETGNKLSLRLIVGNHRRALPTAVLRPGVIPDSVSVAAVGENVDVAPGPDPGSHAKLRRSMHPVVPHIEPPR